MLDYMERHDVTDDYGNVLYNVTAVQQMHTPTWFAASDTATVTKVPAYDTRTSTDKVAELTHQVDALRTQQAAIAAQLRDISAQMALLAGDVPFAGRMAEDAWGVR